MKNTLKLTSASLIVASLTLCFSDLASAQRRGDGNNGRGGQVERRDERGRGNNNGVYNGGAYNNGRNNGVYNGGAYNNGRNNGVYNGGAYNNGYGSNGYNTRHYDRWNRYEGTRRGNHWHYDNGITIRTWRYRYELPALTWDNYFYNSGLRLLGSTSLSTYTTDFDTVFTGDCGYTALQLRVIGNNANIDHLVVHLGNGEIDYIDINAYLQNGAWTPILDLNGYYGRCVQSVVVVGQTITGPYQYPYQATVQIYGRY